MSLSRKACTKVRGRRERRWIERDKLEAITTYKLNSSMACVGTAGLAKRQIGLIQAIAYPSTYKGNIRAITHFDAPCLIVRINAEIVVRQAMK